MDNNILQNDFEKTSCEKCNFICFKLGDYKRHILTAKHQKTINVQNITPNITSCEKCDFVCSRIGDYNRHILTAKHKKLCIHTIATIKQHKCDKCQKEYKHHSSLWNHKQICCSKNEKPNINTIISSDATNIENVVNSINLNAVDTNLLMELVKQNQEFKQIMIQQQNQLIEMASKPSSIVNTNSNNNNNNKTKFNLNVFLNEQCKDALNITDFVSSLQLQLSDLENTGKNGFVEGISKIFIRGLNDLDIHKRPIHCSDIKRETIYVKDKDIWEKENEEKIKIFKTIRQIAHKNIMQIPQWITNNPNCSDYYAKKNNEYLHIMSESMGGIDDEETNKYYNKIVKNVSKEVTIE